MPAGWPKKATGKVAGAAGGAPALTGDAVGDGAGTGSAAGDETAGDGAAAPTPGGAAHAWTTSSKTEALRAQPMAFIQVGNRASYGRAQGD